MKLPRNWNPEDWPVSDHRETVRCTCPTCAKARARGEKTPYEKLVETAQEQTQRRTRQPTPAPEPVSSKLAHDFGTNGLCRTCGDGVSTKAGCKTKPAQAPEPPRKDRFELIELE